MHDKGKTIWKKLHIPTQFQSDRNNDNFYPNFLSNFKSWDCYLRFKAPFLFFFFYFFFSIFNFFSYQQCKEKPWIQADETRDLALIFLTFPSLQSTPHPPGGHSEKLSTGNDAVAIPTENCRSSPFLTTSTMLTQKNMNFTLTPFRFVNLFLEMFPLIVDLYFNSYGSSGEKWHDPFK